MPQNYMVWYLIVAFLKCWVIEWGVNGHFWILVNVLAIPLCTV